MGKPKLIDVSQLPALLPGDRWERFQGLQDAMPKEIHVPDEKLHHATMSGSLGSPRTETKYGVTGEVVAGVDVWRHDPSDAPYIFNKDHYFITRAGTAPDFEYWLHGPFKKNEMDHWVKEVPDEYVNCEVLLSRRSST